MPKSSTQMIQSKPKIVRVMPDTAEEIRRSDGYYKQIAEKHNCSITTVYRIKNNLSHIDRNRTCYVCNKPFLALYGNRIYCSRICALIGSTPQRKNLTCAVFCEYCNKHLPAPTTLEDMRVRPTKRFCSTKCKTYAHRYKGRRNGTSVSVGR